MNSVFSRQMASRPSSSWTVARGPTTSLRQIETESPPEEHQPESDPMPEQQLSSALTQPAVPARPPSASSVSEDAGQAHHGEEGRERSHSGSGVIPDQQVTAAQTQRAVPPAVPPASPASQEAGQPRGGELLGIASQSEASLGPSQQFTPPHTKPLAAPVTEPATQVAPLASNEAQRPTLVSGQPDVAIESLGPLVAGSMPPPDGSLDVSPGGEESTSRNP